MAVNTEQLQRDYDARGIEILKLKELLFTIREIAVGDFLDLYVYLANKELGDFRIAEARFKKILEGYQMSTRESGEKGEGRRRGEGF